MKQHGLTGKPSNNPNGRSRDLTKPKRIQLSGSFYLDLAEVEKKFSSKEQAKQAANQAIINWWNSLDKGI